LLQIPNEGGFVASCLIDVSSPFGLAVDRDASHSSPSSANLMCQ